MCTRYSRPPPFARGNPVFVPQTPLVSAKCCRRSLKTANRRYISLRYNVLTSYNVTFIAQRVGDKWISTCRPLRFSPPPSATTPKKSEFSPYNRRPTVSLTLYLALIPFSLSLPPDTRGPKCTIFEHPDVAIQADRISDLAWKITTPPHRREGSDEKPNQSLTNLTKPFCSPSKPTTEAGSALTTPSIAIVCRCSVFNYVRGTSQTTSVGFPRRNNRVAHDQKLYIVLRVLVNTGSANNSQLTQNRSHTSLAVKLVEGARPPDPISRTSQPRVTFNNDSSRTGDAVLVIFASRSTLP